MRILMLGNSLTSANHMPQTLAGLTGAEVISHTRGGARLSEQLNPKTRLGSLTQAALLHQRWDFVILQEMSHGPITSPGRFFPVQSSSAVRSGNMGPFLSSMPPGPTGGTAQS